MPTTFAQITRFEPRGRHSRLPLGLFATVIVLAVLGVACNESGTSDSATETSHGTNEESETSSTTELSGSSPGTAIAGDTGGGSFDLNSSRSQLKAATEACEVMESADPLFNNLEVTTVEDTKQFVESFVLVVNKMADTTDDADLADRLSTAARNVQRFAERNEYDPARVNSEGQPSYDGSEADFAALDEWYENEIESCSATDDTVPTP